MIFRGSKRGIMELADLILMNKADGVLEAIARHSAADYIAALSLLHPRTRNWQVPVKSCSALEGRGIAEAWELIGDYRKTLTASGELTERRAEQACQWMWSETADSLLTAMRNDSDIKSIIPQLERSVAEGSVPPTLAAKRLLDLFLKRDSN